MLEDILRLASLFDPSSMFKDQMGNPNSAPMANAEPNHVAQDKLLDLLGQFPTRKPNTGLQKLVASIAGLGTGGPVGIAGGQPIGYKSNIPEGMKVKQGLLDQDFNKEVTDYGMKLKPLTELANVERADNTNRRLINSAAATNELGRLRLNETNRENTAKDADRDEDRKIREKLADVAQLKANKRNLKSVTDAKGMLNLLDPDTGEITPTDIDTGKLSDVEKANLKLEGSLQEIQAKLKGARDLEKERYPNGRPSSNTNPSDTQRFIKYFNKANQAINEHPEWKDYLEVDPSTKTFKVQAPSSFLGMGGGDPNIVHQINEFIYGADSSIPSATPNDKDATPAGAPKKDDEVGGDDRVQINNGKENATVSRKNLEAAKKKGWVEGRMK